MNTKKMILHLVGMLFPFVFYCQNISTLKYNAESRNDSWSQIQLGLAYENGDGVEKNPKMAFSWFEKAAYNGDMYAFYNLGRHYEYGLSVAVNKSKALYWYEKAAAAHHAYSCLLLGKWYLHGENITKNYYKAAAYFKDAAFCGNDEGKYEMGLCYAFGYGVKQDSVRALLWLDRAIEDKYYFSYYLKGIMYQDGLSVNKDEKAAFENFLIGDSYNVAACQNSLAKCYLEGKGVEPDTLKAIQYYEKTANNGNMDGQRNLGLIYKYGIGVTKDIQQAIYWFEKSADKKDEESYEELLDAFKKTKDFQSLFKWSLKGSDLNYKSCLNALAYCYAKGEGTSINFKKAVSTIDHAISLFPQDPNLYDSKGEILWLKGSKKAAKEMWNRVNSLDPYFYKEYKSTLNRYITGED